MNKLVQANLTYGFGRRTAAFFAVGLALASLLASPGITNGQGLNQNGAVSMPNKISRMST